jgi:hypothetical protein
MLCCVCCLNCHEERGDLQPSLLNGVTSSKERRQALTQRRQESRPTELPAALVQAAGKGVRLGLIQPVPADVIGLHKYQKGATGTVALEVGQRWWETDSGKAWQAERTEMFKADDSLSDPE